MSVGKLISQLPHHLNEQVRWPVILYAEGGIGANSWVVQPCIAEADSREVLMNWLAAKGYRAEAMPPDELDGWTINIYDRLRPTTVLTVASGDHGLRVGDMIQFSGGWKPWYVRLWRWITRYKEPVVQVTGVTATTMTVTTPEER